MEAAAVAAEPAPIIHEHAEAPEEISDPVAQEHEDIVHDDAREDEAQRIHEAEAVDEDHSAEEISEDEAAAVAQHVAEAQVEEEAREAHRRESAGEEATDSSVPTEDPGLHAEAEHELEESDHHDEDEIATFGEAAMGTETQESSISAHEQEHGEQPENLEAGIPTAEDDLRLSQHQTPQAPEQRHWKARVRDDSRSRMQHPRRGRDRGRRDDRGGNRPQHGHGHHGSQRTQPHRPQLIADMLKQGQEIIVQIAKEPLGKKGARITSHVALPGRFLVYMPTLDHTGVSRKIASAEDRASVAASCHRSKRQLGRRIHCPHGGGQRGAGRNSSRRGIPHPHLVRNQNPLRAAQSSFSASSRPEPRGAHSSRLHHARLWLDLGRFRRRVHEGRRFHEPVPTATRESREALYESDAGL